VTTGRSRTLDAILLLVTAAVSLLAVWSVFSPMPDVIADWTIVGLAVLVIALVVVQILSRPDHLRALQSRQVLQIADRSLAHLRRGLDEETAQEVCRIALGLSEAAAVAITDTDRVLGFAGVGEDHHEVAGQYSLGQPMKLSK